MTRIKRVIRSLLLFLLEGAPFSVRKKIVSGFHGRIPGKFAEEGNLLFDSVFFELRTRCNGKCGFCAASVQNESRPDITMSFDLYAKVIADLKEMGFTGRVAFFINSEPLLVRDLGDYVSHARENLPEAWLQVTTNGKSLKPDRAHELLQAGLNEISVNNYGDDLAAPVPPHLIAVRDEVLPQYYAADLIKPGHGPDPELGNAIFRFNIFPRLETAILTNRAGTAPNKKAVEGRNPRGFCKYPFTQFNITADGRVSKCCADLFFGEPMGNVSNQSVAEIWNGEKFRLIRSQLLKNDRGKNAMCEGCDYIGARPDRETRFTRLIEDFLARN